MKFISRIKIEIVYKKNGSNLTKKSVVKKRTTKKTLPKTN